MGADGRPRGDTSGEHSGSVVLAMRWVGGANRDTSELLTQLCKRCSWSQKVIPAFPWMAMEASGWQMKPGIPSCLQIHTGAAQRGPTVGRSHNRLHLILRGPGASPPHLNPSISALNRLSPIFLPFIRSFDGIQPLFLSQMCWIENWEQIYPLKN